MWFEQPDVCRKPVLDFWRGIPESRKAVLRVPASGLLRADKRQAGPVIQAQSREAPIIRINPRS